MKKTTLSMLFVSITTLTIKTVATETPQREQNLEALQRYDQASNIPTPDQKSFELDNKRYCVGEEIWEPQAPMKGEMLIKWKQRLLTEPHPDFKIVGQTLWQRVK